MVFVETPLFTKYVQNYLNDDEYRDLQDFLIKNPRSGDIISGTGGLQKIRWSAKGKGKRGGARIIYFWKKAEDQIYLLAIYAKSEVQDLSSNEKKVLKKLVEEW